MDNSQDQFQTLLANLAPRVNNALSRQNSVPPIALLLLENDEVETVLYVAGEDEGLADEMNNLQRLLIEKADETSAVAACLSYPDYEREEVVALLENSENTCAKCRIPVVMDETLQLDLAKMTVGDGMVFVFGDGGP